GGQLADIPQDGADLCAVHRSSSCAGDSMLLLIDGRRGPNGTSFFPGAGSVMLPAPHLVRASYAGGWNADSGEDNVVGARPLPRLKLTLRGSPSNFFSLSFWVSFKTALSLSSVILSNFACTLSALRERRNIGTAVRTSPDVLPGANDTRSSRKIQ